MSSKRGWDGSHDGPDACTCETPRPELFYGRLVCGGCDGDIKSCDDCEQPMIEGGCKCNERATDPLVDAACYRDERGER